MSTILKTNCRNIIKKAIPLSHIYVTAFYLTKWHIFVSQSLLVLFKIHGLLIRIRPPSLHLYASTLCYYVQRT